MRVHLPSGRVVDVPATVAARTELMADFCPRRAEHTMSTSSKRYRATVHPYCGFAVVYVRKGATRPTHG